MFKFSQCTLSNSSFEIRNKDENDKIKFSVLAKDLLILESTDNYVSVFYILEGKVQRELLRNTMKNLEDFLKDSPIIRCHRSFMVNSENIEFVKKAGKKLNLKVRLLDRTIPVSEKYSPLFLDFLSWKTTFYPKIRVPAP